MIITSSYKNWKSNKYYTYKIAETCGKNPTNQDLQLAPKGSILKIWHKNRGILPDVENDQIYIKEYYNQILSNLDPDEVYQKLDNYIILSSENPDEIGPRHIIAAWFELFLDVQVPEKSAVDYTIVDEKRSDYVKNILEEIIKNSYNMHGFSSLRAAYLFEKGERLEKKAMKCIEDSQEYGCLMTQACFLRCDADEAECKEKQRIREKK